MSESIIYQLLQDDVCELILNRPDKINTMNREMISKLSIKLSQIAEQPALRVLVISGRGQWFCGGADLKWMAAARELEDHSNLEDAKKLAELFQLLNNLPIATIAKVNGGAMGGGIGLLCCCDIVIASENSQYSFGELKLGLLPATIMPYVLAAIGVRQARRFMLSAEAFSCQTAKTIGLVHEVVSQTQLEQEVTKQIENILKTAPQTFRNCKAVIENTAPGSNYDIESLAMQLATSRSSAEAREGINAFFNKTQPSWVQSYQLPLPTDVDKES